MVFVVLLLAFASMLFGKDIDDVVIAPIASMMQQLKKIRSDPLADVDTGSGMETDVVFGALARIGKMLQWAFGEAGRDIIAANLKSVGLEPVRRFVLTRGRMDR